MPLSVLGGLAASLSVVTAAKLALAHLTYVRLGWREHGRIGCDLRRKHAVTERALQQLVNRFHGLVRLTVCVVFINTGSCLALALDAAGSGGASALHRKAATGLVVTSALAMLLLGWLAVAVGAVRRCSQERELVANVTMTLLLLWPVSVGCV